MLAFFNVNVARPTEDDVQNDSSGTMSLKVVNSNRKVCKGNEKQLRMRSFRRQVACNFVKSKK